VHTRLRRAQLLAAAAVFGLLLIAVAHNSGRWIGTTFPGFFVMANRVVPSVALPDWPDSSALYQHPILAVDGMPVTSSAEVYGLARQRPPGTPLRYTLGEPDGNTSTAVVPTRQFVRSDYVLLFGSFLLTGTAFAAAGLLVFAFQPYNPASLALLILGLAAGTFGITAVDLYDPHWLFRLHVIGETLVGPGFVHLALVFPRDRIGRRRRLALSCVYGPPIIMALVYESVLYMPAAYSQAHLVASVAQGIGGLLFILGVSYELLTTKSVLVRRRLAVVALGTLCGFLVPTLLMTASGVFAGSVAVNAAGLTAFFFPFALAYAIVKQDRFEIDVLLRRAMTYTVVVATIAAMYFLVLYAIGVLMPGQLSAFSPVALALLNFALLFLIASIRQRVQEWVDRVFFRQKYQVEEALSALSLALASARAVSDVVAHASKVFAHTLAPNHTTVLLRTDEDGFRAAGMPAASQDEIRVEPGLVERLERGEVLARYEWEDRGTQSLPPVWSVLDAELMVSLRSGDGMIGMLVCGAKSSGRAYTMNDIAFLRTAGNQIALALTNAAAFGQLEELNTNLERIVRERTRALHDSNAELNLSVKKLQEAYGWVRERTSALHDSNAELNRSLSKLQEAYRRLEQSQASLLRTDRLATLGRLTAGIAHEMNTPLSAVLNALKILGELGQEYADSIDDPDVQPQDHREIAAEILSTSRAAAAWATKAASYISSVKAHGREGQPAISGTILVSAVVAETRALLSHRLRTSSCQIEFEEETPGITLEGDPGRLGQVVLNLCTNAIDAYEDAGLNAAPIMVRAARRAEQVTLTVADFAGGIPPHVLPHIFDELYTTKGPGRGTGLGLWIARNLVEQALNGTLAVETAHGLGSVFTASFPLRHSLQVAETPAAASPARLPVAASRVASLH
jgi:signal transduction histidine kinase